MTNPDKVCTEAVKAKEAGNEAYKNNDIDEALAKYTEAIKLSSEANDDKTLAVCLKNRAAVHLKEEDFEAVVFDCNRSLELAPNDPKALFRRCQAHEALGQVDSAYKDAREVHRLDPNNPALQPVLVRLHKAVSQKVSQ